MLLGTSDNKAIICNDGSSHQQNNARQNETIHLRDLLVILCFCILFLCNTHFTSVPLHIPVALCRVQCYQRDCLRFCLFADGDIRADDFLS